MSGSKVIFYDTKKNDLTSNLDHSLRSTYFKPLSTSGDACSSHSLAGSVKCAIKKLLKKDETLWFFEGILNQRCDIVAF